MTSEIFSVGLTGGIASGKSLVAETMAEQGALLIDADRLAREALAPDAPLLQPLRQRFGDTIFAQDGSVDRAALGQLVFGDAEARQALNELIHPVVRAEAARRRSIAPAGSLVVEDIPLLVETGQQDRFDYVLVVQAPEALRIQRMVQDRGMAPADAHSRISAQASDAERAAVADKVLVNAGSPAQLRAEVAELTQELLRRAHARG